MWKICVRITSVFSLALLLGPHLSAQHASKFGTIPLYFEQNKGQTDPQAHYIARSSNLVGFVLQDGWTLSLNGQPISMHIAHADPKAALVPENATEGITNYYLGPRAITALQHYSSVRAKNIRPGIDILYHGNEGELEYDLVIHPGADMDALWLRFEGSHAALADNGDILLKTTTGEVRQHKPHVWQETKGRQTEVECSYVIAKSGDVGFVLSNYDQSVEVVVDPIISYSTYLNGTSQDFPGGIAADPSGYVYVTGATTSTDFPRTSGTYRGNSDVFVTKLNPSGTGLVYSTLIGGSNGQGGNGIALDSAGNAYVTGSTSSTDFPFTVNHFTSGQHAFVLKLDTTGNIVYAAALAGNSDDSGAAIATDASGSAYLVGTTSSTNFPVTAGSYQSTPAGGVDGFVAKLDSTGQISYATYLGGTRTDLPTAIAVDAAGNTFVGGTTSSVDFPTTPGAYATKFAGVQDSFGGNNDAFVAKLNPTGSALVYATYLGGTDRDALSGLTVDAAGNCYVAGNTRSVDFPTTAGAFSTNKVSVSFFISGFVAKLSATGASLIYSTFLTGTTGDDSPVAIGVDSTGAAYVLGTSKSSNFPTTPGAFKSVLAQPATDWDMFLTKVSVDGSALSYSTRLGSSDFELAGALALDGTGGIYIIGISDSLAYPTSAGAYQSSNPRSLVSIHGSMVVTKVDFSVPTLCNPSVSPQSQSLTGRGGPISFNLSLSPGCPWEAVPFRSVTLNGPRSGIVTTSPIVINGTAGQNSDTTSGATLSIQIGTATFTINQDAGLCQDPGISPLSVAFDSSGGIRTLTLGLPNSCYWTAVPGSPWLSVSNNPSGAGPASITIFAGPNNFSARSTTLTIAGKAIAITQSGSTCNATANIAVTSTSSQGGDGVISIATNPTTCNWSAYAGAPWIQLNSSANTGQGSGFVPFVLAANPGGAPRTGQILIGDVTFSVTQAAGPSGSVGGYSISTVAGGGGSITNQGDGGPALNAYLNFPSGLAVDPINNNIYFADAGSRIRVVTPDGQINTFAGGGSGTGENIPATSAKLLGANSVAVDSTSAVYVNEAARIRKINQGQIVTLAGSNQAGFGGDGGPATLATFSDIDGIAVDPAGNIYITDRGNGRIRKVSGGTITTFAGGGNSLSENVPATSATFNLPEGIALDSDANLLIVDNGRDRVRKVTQGIITTVAGGGGGGDGGPATSAELFNPMSVTADTLGNIFILPSGNSSIRKVSVDGTISTVTGTTATQSLTADKLGNVYFADSSAGPGYVRKLTALPSFCSYAVSAPQIPSAGGVVQISVNAASGCRWGALLLPTWLTANGPATGIGAGTITLTASSNPGTTPRTATLAIAGMPIPITQATANASTASLNILKTHVGNFSPGQQKASYVITVSNAGAATTGLVTVTDILPSGLSLVGISGAGWTCQSTTCTRSDVLSADSTYPAITVTVNVGANATSPQANQANVSGGGSAAASVSDSTAITMPTVSVNRAALNFSANGATSPQSVTVNFAGSPGIPWTAISNQSNIVVLQGSGNGGGSFQVSGSSGPNGVVTVTAPGAVGSPKQIQVNITKAPLGNPFGSFDTPADNTTGVAGAIPVTGWALDAVEVIKVDIWREPVGSEPAGALIFIGDSVFVEGARPDVESLNPNIPFNYRAGWGYQMLTNFLPNGNGTFKLHAIAHNKAGNSTDLGTKTIIVDNAHASKPFGTIDTPGQGGTASGNAFVNFGWALTQSPNKIPIDGSTISVVIDGQVVGHPTYNQFRSDIASLFPGYLNSGGAVGFFYIDTTTLTNGVHTISWNVFDNAGHGEGIGSRYFSVFNTGTNPTEPEDPTVTQHIRSRAVTVRERFPENLPHSVEIEEVGQLELPLSAINGYQLVNGEHRPLPIGSSLKHGVFYWQPGPGFLGDFHLVFEHNDSPDTHIRVKIRIGKTIHGLLR